MCLCAGRQPGSVRPLGAAEEEVLARVEELVASPFTKVVLDRGELTVHVARERLVEVMTALRNDAHLRFEGCMTFLAGIIARCSSPASCSR